MTSSLSKELNLAITAAREASQVVRSVYERKIEVEHKALREPVTEADRRVNALLVERFSAAFPEDGIIAEESLPADPVSLGRQVTAPRVWFIDPLDGTKEFIARNGEFSVMIGLAVGGRAKLGVVAMPATGHIAIGVVGEGAWMLASDGAKSELCVSTQARVEESRAIVSRSHLSDSLARLIDAIGPSERVQCGSVGVKAARIAEQHADFYVNVHAPGGAKLWDGCAPEAVLAAAGGRTTDLTGRPIDYATTTLELTGGYLATNGRLHEPILQRITDVKR